MVNSLIGRAVELAAIERMLDALADGEGGILAISGEPGIGKTRLIAELVKRAAGGGQTVLAGRSTELELEAPFAALVAAIDHHLEGLDATGQEALVSRQPYLADVFPALERGEGSLRVVSERYRHHRAIRWLLEQLASPRGVVLVLDDLHWADSATVEAVAHLLRRPPVAPVLLVLAFRAGQLPRGLTHALTGALRDGPASVLTLATLTERQTGQLLGDVPIAERHRVFRETGGNPFYIEQLRRLIAAGEGGPGDTIPPPVVTASVTQELADLEPLARGLLDAAAVAGEPFDADLAIVVAGADPEQALESIDVLVSRDLIRAEDSPRGFRFRHPIVRRAVYDALPPGRRIALHERAAQALVARGAGAPAIAQHLAQSARPGDDAAIDLLRTAALQKAPTAPASAARWLTAALALLPVEDSARRMPVLASLGQAQAASGHLDQARETLLQITRELPPASGLPWAQAVAALARVDLALGRHRGARSRLEAAITVLPGPDRPEAAALYTALAMDAAYRGDIELGRRSATQALSAAGTGPPAASALAHAVLALMLQLQGAPALAASAGHVTAAAEIFEHLTDDEIATQPDLPLQLGLAEFHLERIAASAGHLERGVAVALAGGSSQFLPMARSFIAYDLFLLGHLDAAITAAEEALDAERLLSVDVNATWALTVASTVWSSVDIRRAMRLGREAVEMVSQIEPSMVSDTTHAHFGMVCGTAGQHAACLDHMAQAGGPEFVRFAESGRRCRFVESIVRSALALGRRQTAREALECGERIAADLDLPLAQAALDRSQALVLIADGQPEPAIDAARSAVESADAAAAPLDAGRSRIVLGEALTRAGHHEAAVQLLRLAHTELARIGARRDAQEVARALRLLGVAAPARVARRTGDRGTRVLSRRETEVAGLVAEGLSNGQIAPALFLSTKTVEGHLRRIFEKLDVRSRAQVAASVARGAD